ncbi:MAG: FtsX-like permease family protein [Cyclobacteriaceae bacterium]
MILALAWKNIWRSKRRSFVVIGAIIVGVWSLIFMFAFYNSFIEAFSRNGVNHDYSHIQIHNEDYLLEPGLEFQLSDVNQMETTLDQMAEVQSWSARQIVNGMLASPKTNVGVQIYGVQPAAEGETTGLEEQLVDGTYFETIKRNPILISEKLADKLKVKVRSKVVITLQNLDREITAASFRVEGIFKSKSPRINEAGVYVRFSDLSRLTAVDGINEIAVYLNNSEQILLVKESLAASTTDLVRTYREIAPEFDMMEQQSATTKQIVTVIIMLALLFGIVNTMLMAVLERTKEIGMLRSIGMHKKSVFKMIILETCMMSIIAGPIGLILGYLTNTWLGTNGMDLSSYATALEQYGMDAIFYPSISNATYPALMMVVILTAFLGAIYPAIKAIRLNPLEAIRKL